MAEWESLGMIKVEDLNGNHCRKELFAKEIGGIFVLAVGEEKLIVKERTGFQISTNAEAGDFEYVFDLPGNLLKLISEEEE
jgi:hypothetical protein